MTTQVLSATSLLPAACQQDGTAETADVQLSSQRDAELEALLAQLTAMDITPGAADGACSTLLQDKQAAAKQRATECYYQFRAMFYSHVEEARAVIKRGEDPTPLRSGRQMAQLKVQKDKCVRLIQAFMSEAAAVKQDKAARQRKHTLGTAPSGVGKRTARKSSTSATNATNEFRRSLDRKMLLGLLAAAGVVL